MMNLSAVASLGTPKAPQRKERAEAELELGTVIKRPVKGVEGKHYDYRRIKEKEISETGTNQTSSMNPSNTKHAQAAMPNSKR